jgi:hypothetical protein
MTGVCSLNAQRTMRVAMKLLGQLGRPGGAQLADPAFPVKDLRFH